MQYTRNMVTGASTADLAIVLIDARHGVVEQTKRHAFIASLLGIPHLVVAVNKMDLVEWSEERFDEIVRDFAAFRAQLAVREVTFIPISALKGDNVVDRGEHDWYSGPSLLEHLESIDVSSHDRNTDDLRFPVQWVIREGEQDFRGLAGQIQSGVVSVGDPVVVLPSEVETTVARIHTYDGDLEQAGPRDSVTLVLADDVDASRGDLVCHPTDRPSLEREFTADVCWFADAPLRAGSKYLIKHATHATRVVVDEIVDAVDVTTLERVVAPQELALNGIARVRLRTAKPMAFDPYLHNRGTGSFILIDEVTNDTVAGGMIAPYDGNLAPTIERLGNFSRRPRKHWPRPLLR